MNSANFPGFCSRCEDFPQQIQDSGLLYLWFPVNHSLGKVVKYLRKKDIQYQQQENEQCLIIHLEKETENHIEALEQILTQNELQNTKSLFKSGDEKPTLQDFGNMIPLGNFIRLIQSHWVLEMLSAERVTNQFQPIVDANDTSSIFAQEALLRGIAPDGSLISPGRFFPLAAEAGILVQLDFLARRSAIANAQKHQIQDHLFINFTPTSIYDPASCLRSTIKAIDEAGIAHEQVVFEVVESERVKDIQHLKGILNVYREAGFSMALDDFGAGFSNFELLHELRPDFLKLDMGLIRNVHKDPYKALLTEKILEIAVRLNIKTVAEGIETPEELDWVQRRGATFVQGYLIAKPSTIPTTEIPAIQTNSVTI